MKQTRRAGFGHPFCSRPNRVLSVTAKVKMKIRKQQGSDRAVAALTTSVVADSLRSCLQPLGAPNALVHPSMVWNSPHRTGAYAKHAGHSRREAGFTLV